MTNPATTESNEGGFRPTVLIALPYHYRNQSARLIESLIPDGLRDRTVWLQPPPAGARPGFCRPETGEIDTAPILWHRIPKLHSALQRTGLLSLLDVFLLRARIRPVAERLMAVVDFHRPRILWGLAHLHMVPVLLEVARRFRGHFHVTIHDHPTEFELGSIGFAARGLLRRTIRPLLERADSIDVVSATMRDWVVTTSGKEPLVLVPAPRYPLAIEAAPPPGDEWVLGVSGCWDARRNIRALIDAWNQKSPPARRLRLRWIDGHPDFAGPNGRVHVEVLPFMPEEDAIAVLKGCHASYLAYGFDRRNAILRRYSFPSKYSMYFPACRPVFVHAPEDSVVVSFVREHALGVCCASLEAQDILRGWAEMERIMAAWDEFARHCQRFAESSYNVRVQRDALRAAFDGALARAGHRA